MIVKPGYKTTELWAGIAASVASWLEVWGGTLGPKWAAVVTAASVLGYQLSRAITKHGVATSGKPVVTVPAVPAAPPAAAPPVQAV